MSRRLATLLLLVVLITTVEQVSSRPTDRNSTLMRYYCSMYKGLSSKYFLSNLNTTLSGLRRQLTTSGYAAERTLLNGESVWGVAWCRGYVSIPDCLSCFDYAVDRLKICGTGNGAHAIYSDCDLRYENFNFFSEANDRAGTIVCDNTALPQPTEFREAAEKLFLDLQIAAPRAPKYYAASTRKVASGNATVYAFAQCTLNISQSVCLQCLQSRSRSLLDCLNTTSGRAMDPGCFMRYDRTPFFGQNQTTDISSLIWEEDHSSKKKAIIGGVVGGVSFLLLLLAILLWFHRSKKAARRGRQEATNNFGDENKLGGGMFGEVYKGTLKNGMWLQLKNLVASNRRKTHFDDEVKILSNVHHRHLVRLLGYCTKGTHLFLVHAYMPNHSLDQFLYGDKTVTFKLETKNSGYVAPEYAIMDTYLRKWIHTATSHNVFQLASRPTMSEVVTLLSEKPLEERPPVRSIITEDDMKIQVSTESSISSATASTIQLSGVKRLRMRKRASWVIGREVEWLKCEVLSMRIDIRMQFSEGEKEVVENNTTPVPSIVDEPYSLDMVDGEVIEKVVTDLPKHEIKCLDQNKEEESEITGCWANHSEVAPQAF
ncbi:hypothetical protein E3N88_01724 [Mikania micrantha]|uniref:Gnk2-homologous domain-containing protein n=1 Tax=Mikania micrantha TaxID=192012 RepID=A0A5N6Q435_9ASTR|nr:hypothetical protein E3N88_01724 [Mikania micrantha]